MTYGDIIVHVLEEITLESTDQIREMVKFSFEAAGRYAAFTDELTQDETDRIFAECRRDPSELLRLYAAAKSNLRR
jgi:hypothetical protein